MNALEVAILGEISFGHKDIALHSNSSILARRNRRVVESDLLITFHPITKTGLVCHIDVTESLQHKNI